MCGILTWYQRKGFTKQDVLTAVAAMQSMAHRGPDGEGILLVNVQTGVMRMLRTPGTPEGLHTDITLDEYEDGSANLMLGHRRLSIIDLGLRGFQPMQDEAGNVIIFNGEVYNYIELRERLVAKGYTFKTTTDTEVVLAAHREWGRSCLNRFNGMWSFCIFNVRSSSVFISVDRFGIKPMYYYNDSDTLLLMSEAKAFRHFPQGSTEINQRYIDLFLKYGLLDTDHMTPFKKLKRMLPAHSKVISLIDGKEKMNERYWEPPSGVTRLKLKDAVSQLKELMNDSLNLRLRADVPWGITLSGGLDSSLIAYRLSHILRVNDIAGSIYSFTASFPGRSEDESAFAMKVERDLHLTPHHVDAVDQFTIGDFERFIWHMDFPVASSSPYASYSLYRKVNETGIKMTLSGQGSDELFSGYHHHFYAYAADMVFRLQWMRYATNVMGFSRMKKINPLQVTKTAALTWLSRKRSPVMYAEDSEKQLWQDLNQWVLPALLRYEDRASMAWGVEARVPFLDYKMVEFAQHLPAKMKIRDGWQKFIIRKALEGEAPAEIVWRKDKKGYVTPEKELQRKNVDGFLSYVPHLKKVGIEVSEDDMRRSIMGQAGKPLAHTRLLNLGAWIHVNGIGG